MRNPGGYLIIEDPDPWRSRGEVARQEYDTTTCGHCNGMVKEILPDMRRLPADLHMFRKYLKSRPDQDVHVCKRCMNFVCQGCYDKVVCVPFEKKLEEWEEKVARGIEREITLKTYGM